MSLPKTGFDAHIDERTRVVILGSLPGEQSLSERRYYAHPSNQFWKLVGAVLDRDLVTLPYTQRISALLHGGIGLWDVVKSAHRRGSGDAEIRDAQANALAQFAASIPGLRALAFNGAKAAAIGRTQLAGLSGLTEPALVDLPSSSAAHAAMPLAEKRKIWLGLRDFLIPALQP